MEGQFEPIDTVSELDKCKMALCFKEHELFNLRADVQTQQAVVQTLAKSVERLEKSLSAGMDRLSRSVNRLGGCRDASPTNFNNNKRRRREN
jgi:hypothetical protein